MLRRSSAITAVLLIFTAFCIAPSLQAETCTTVQGGNWTADATWDCGASGDASSDGIPGSGDTAEIGHSVIVDQDITVGTLNVNAGGFVDPPGPSTGLTVLLTVENDASINDSGVTWNGVRTVGGNSSTLDFDIGGSLTNDGTIDYAGVSESITLAIGGNLNNNSGDITAASAKLDIEGSLTNSGTLTGGGTIDVGSSVTNSGTLTGGGTVNVGSSVTNSGGLTVSSILDVRSTVTNKTAGLLTVEAGAEIQVGGNFTNDGSFSANSTQGNKSKVVFTGDLIADDVIEEQTLSGDFFDENAFQSVSVESGAVVDPVDVLNETNSTNNPVQIDGGLSVKSGGTYGTGNAANQTVTEGSDLIYNGTTFGVEGNLFANKVTFDASSGTTTVTGAVFAEVSITQNTTVQVGGSDFAVVGLVGINSQGTLDTSNNTLELLGDLRVNGTLTATSGTVLFRGLGRSTCCSAPDFTTGGGNDVQEVIGSRNITFGTLEARDVDNEGNPDANDVPDTDVDLAPGGNNVRVKGQFTVDEASVNSSRPVILESNLSVINSGDFTVDENRRLEFAAGNPQFIDAPTALDLPTIRVDKTSNAVDVRTPVTLDLLDIRSGTVSPTKTITVNNLLDMRGGTFKPTNTTSINGTLRLAGGTVDATSSGGDVILVSDGSNDAFVEYVDDGSGNVAGEVTGNLIMQRQLDDDQDFYALAGPVGQSSNPTYQDFLETTTSSGTNDLWIQGIPNGDAGESRSSFANVLLYDETVGGNKDEGFEPIGDMLNPVPSGKGFFVYAFADDDFDAPGSSDFPKVIDSQVDPYDQTSFDFGAQPDITLEGTDPDNDGYDNLTGDITSTDGIEDGWILLGNPYLTPIDWDELNRGSNLDNAVYVYDPQNQDYDTWDGGNGDLSGGVIAPLQAFFVRVASEGDASLSIDDITTAQVPGATNPFRKSESQQTRALTLNLQTDERQRDTHVSFQNDAKVGTDRKDAFELQSPVDTETNVSFYSVLQGVGFASQSLPYELSEETTLNIEAKASGCVSGQPYSTSATMTWPKIRNIPAGADLILTDTQTGEEIDLRTQEEYTFDLTADTDCSTQTNAKTQGSADREVPNLRNPSVVTHTQSKASGPSTRFKLTIKPNGTLPVEFTSFTGSVADNAAKLEWTTATEQNNAGFQVQQKVDGSFQNIEGAFVEGAGTAEEPQSYSYRVEDLDAGQHTFRLKQVDVDGGSSFSKETTVKVGLDSQYELQAYPNPISEQATIKFAVKESQDVTLELYNTLGQRVQVLHQGAVPSSQTRTVSLQASDLSSGLYIVRMRGESFSTTKSVTVVR